MFKPVRASYRPPIGPGEKRPRKNEQPKPYFLPLRVAEELGRGVPEPIAVWHGRGWTKILSAEVTDKEWDTWSGRDGCARITYHAVLEDGTEFDLFRNNLTNHWGRWYHDD